MATEPNLPPGTGLPGFAVTCLKAGRLAVLGGAIRMSLLRKSLMAAPADSEDYDGRMSDHAIHIACLCAAWCRLCDEYAPVLEQVTSELMATHGGLRRHWIDIEDEADLVGDFDVETFPTLVVVGPDGVRFAGPLTPQPDTLRRLLRAAVVDAPVDAGWPAVAPEIQAFAVRLRGRVEPR